MSKLIIHPISVPDICLNKQFAHYLQIELRGLLRAPIQIAQEQEALLFYPITIDVIPLVEQKTMETVNTMILLEQEQLKTQLKRLETELQDIWEAAYRAVGDDWYEQGELLLSIEERLREFLGHQAKEGICPECFEKAIYQKGADLLCAACGIQGLRYCKNCNSELIREGEGNVCLTCTLVEH